MNSFFLILGSISFKYHSLISRWNGPIFPGFTQLRSGKIAMDYRLRQTYFWGMQWWIARKIFPFVTVEYVDLTLNRPGFLDLVQPGGGGGGGFRPLV